MFTNRRLIVSASLSLAGTMMMATSLRAEAPTYTVAKENKALPSFFSLEFGAPGNASIGDIARTDIVMRYDLVASKGSARFLDYQQDVASLNLPDGQGGPGFDTGAIKIEIIESESAQFSFDEQTRTGEFTTSDTYAVYFEGDLSLFGIESPFVLPSDSTGTMQFHPGSETSGTIDMIWEGEGVIGEPPFELPFFYRCEVHTEFQIPEQSDFNADAVVDRDDFSFLWDCFSGVNVDYDHPVCELADLDLDGDVDRYDLRTFRADQNAK